MSGVRTIERVVTARGLAGFVNDDQAAILAGRARDGFLYTGAPITPGYRGVRQSAEALSLLLLLDDGSVAHGDCVSVQYSGAGGRDPVFSARAGQEEVERVLAPALEGIAVNGFRTLCERLADLSLTTAVHYGASQALLDAAARAAGTTMAEVVAAEHGNAAPLREVPIFAQTGEERHNGVDKMIVKRVDELPHGLINTLELAGEDGEGLRTYVRWVRDRVLAHAPDGDYAPVLHFDVYGTLGRVLPDAGALAAYLTLLELDARPFRLRIEHPLDAGSRDAQAHALADLRARLRAHGATVDVVVDEWCNTLEDVRVFLAHEAADMVHVKTPDLGGIEHAIDAVLACREHGVTAYFGGSCTDTERSAQVSAQAAMGIGADLVLAKPGMGVDEGVMITRNEMRRTLALAKARGEAPLPDAASFHHARAVLAEASRSRRRASTGTAG